MPNTCIKNRKEYEFPITKIIFTNSAFDYKSKNEVRRPSIDQILDNNCYLKIDNNGQ